MIIFELYNNFILNVMAKKVKKESNTKEEKKAKKNADDTTTKVVEKTIAKSKEIKSNAKKETKKILEPKSKSTKKIIEVVEPIKVKKASSNKTAKKEGEIVAEPIKVKKAYPNKIAKKEVEIVAEPIKEKKITSKKSTKKIKETIVEPVIEEQPKNQIVELLPEIEIKVETEQLQDDAVAITKSAKKRAKKKAKKLREMMLELGKRQEQEEEQEEITTPTQGAKTQKNNKKQQNKSFESRLEPLAVLDLRVEEQQPVIEESLVNYTSNYRRQQKPIPWVDLSKLEEDEMLKPVVEVEDISEEQAEQPVAINPKMLLSPQQRRDAFFQNFYRDIEKFVVSEMLVEKGSKVVIAVSGGVDSVVLLDVFANLADTYKFQISIAHYNHNLRDAASLEDEKFVNNLAETYNIPFYTASGKVKQYAEKNGMSIEEAARFLRYTFFERTTRTINAKFIATAHTSDDSAETFLLNLFRGAGLTGLSGIPVKRQFVKDVIIIRPFLRFPKQALIDYADKRGLQWRDDETNLQDKYVRNKIRLDLIPKLKKDYSPAINEVINRAAKLIQGADRIIHNYVKTHLQKLLFDISNDSISIKLPLFKTFDEFIRGEMLQTILMKYFRTGPPNMKIIDRILKLESSDVGAICDISKNIFAVKDRQAIVISKKNPINVINKKIKKKGNFQINEELTFVLTEIKPENVEYNKNDRVEFFDFDLISKDLVVRNWEHSDEFNPLGMAGSTSISDFLMNEKVPFLDKPNVLVLTNNENEIIWVCKHRISDKYKITTKTQKVLKIEIKVKGIM